MTSKDGNMKGVRLQEVPYSKWKDEIGSRRPWIFGTSLVRRFSERYHGIVTTSLNDEGIRIRSGLEQLETKDFEIYNNSRTGCSVSNWDSKFV